MEGRTTQTVTTNINQPPLLHGGGLFRHREGGKQQATRPQWTQLPESYRKSVPELASSAPDATVTQRGGTYA
jgi:hypothetical protein